MPAQPHPTLSGDSCNHEAGGQRTAAGRINVFELERVAIPQVMAASREIAPASLACVAGLGDALNRSPRQGI